MINRHVGVNQWASWKQFPWLGMVNVTDAYVADAQYLHFSDASHIDIVHPQKGSTDLVVQSVSTQFNASGWNGSASYLGGCNFRADSFAADIAGSDKPFSMAWEFRPITCPTSSALFWANEGTSGTKFHALLYNGTNGNVRVVRDDGTTSKSGAVAAMGLNTRNVLIQTFSGTSVTTRLNGSVIETAADLDVGPIAFTHWAMSEAVTTGISNVSVSEFRAFLYGNGKVWSPTEIAIIESAMRNSAGV